MILYPPILFFAIWSLVIFLQSLSLSELLLPLNIPTYYLVFGSTTVFLVVWFLSNRAEFQHMKFNWCGYRRKLSLSSTNSRAKILLLFWMLMTLGEIAHSGNIPLLSTLGLGPNVRYTEFGFPVVHGLLNSVYFVLVLHFFICWRIGSGIKWWFFLLCLWPILTMQRMLFVALFFQIIYTEFLIRSFSIRLRQYIYFMVAVTFIVFLFGYIGDVRSGRDHFLQLSRFSADFPTWLPSGVAWIYMYFTTPINNIIYSIASYSTPSGIPASTMFSILPNSIRTYLYDIFSVTDFSLYTNGFNAVSIFSHILRDFGYLFGIFFFIPVALLGRHVFDRSLKSIVYLNLNVAFSYGLANSIFSSHLISLVFVAQGIIGYVMYRGIRF